MRPVALLMVCACALLGACEGPTTPMDAHDLSVAAQQVQSLAGEAEWLAQQVRARSVSANMAWVHQQALGEDAAKLTRELAKPVPQDLRATYETVAALNTRLQTQVNRIAPAANHPDELEALQREFHAVAQQARPLGQRS
jgi:uncharacterized lipoprotein YmbA